MSHHKSSGRAVIYFPDGCVYLGPWKSAEARGNYDRIIAEWLANGRRAPRPASSGMTVGEIMAAYLEHCQNYSKHADGTPTSEVDNMRQVLRVVRKLYSKRIAAEFGPLALKAVREEMMRMGWCRTNINRAINRVKGMFQWATANEMLAASVYHGLQTVAGLRAGRSEARESDPVKPVSEEHVYNTLRYLSRTVAAMVKLQLLTGMRPGEVCTMRSDEIDRTSEIWIYRPLQHKTLYHGHLREIAIRPR